MQITLFMIIKLCENYLVPTYDLLHQVSPAIPTRSPQHMNYKQKNWKKLKPSVILPKFSHTVRTETEKFPSIHRIISEDKKVDRKNAICSKNKNHIFTEKKPIYSWIKNYCFSIQYTALNSVNIHKLFIARK